MSNNNNNNKEVNFESLSIETSSVHSERLNETTENEDVPVVNLCGSHRLLIGFLLCFCTFTLYSQRQIFNMSMFCMIDKSFVEDNTNSSCKSFYTDTSKTEIPPGPYQWDKNIQGIMLGSFYWGYCFQFFGGLIGSRIGHKAALTTAVVISSTASILMPFAANWNHYVVIALRVITGLGQCFIYPSALPLISKWSIKSERSKLASFIFAGSSMGIIFSTAVSGPMCSTSYWEFNFIIAGTMGFIWLLPWVYFVANSPEKCVRISQRELDYIRKNSNKIDYHLEASPLKWPIAKIFKSRSILVIIFTNILSDFTLYGILAVFPGYLSEVYGVDIVTNSYISAGEYGFLWLSTVISGIVSDQLINSKLISTSAARKTFNSIGMMIPSVLFSIIGFLDCTNFSIAVFLLVAAGGFPGAYLSSGYLINALDVSGSYGGVIIGLSNSLGSISGILAPYVAKSITKDETMLQWRLCFIIFSCVLFTGGLIFLIFSKSDVEEWASLEKKQTSQSISNGNRRTNKNISFESHDVLVPSDSFDEKRSNFKNVVLERITNGPNNSIAETHV